MTLPPRRRAVSTRGHRHLLHPNPLPIRFGPGERQRTRAVSQVWEKEGLEVDLLRHCVGIATLNNRTIICPPECDDLFAGSLLAYFL